MSWYESNRDALFARADAFEIIRNELLQYTEPVIVETGGLRSVGNVGGDGNSTCFFDEIAGQTSGRLVSIDLDAICAENVAKLELANTWAYTGDSLEVIPDLWSLHVNCLYLDSFDVDFGNDEPAARHALHEYLLARKFLQRDALVCVDDNLWGNGKGRLLAMLADLLGWECLHDGYVKVWRTNGYL